MHFYVYVLLLLLLPAMILFNSKEDYCICTSKRGGRGQYCHEGSMGMSYNGGLNETQDFNKIKKGWSNVSPGDYEWSEKCSDIN